MSKNYIITILVCLLAGMIPAYAQTYHSWSGTIGDMTFNAGGTHIVFIDGDVNITGTITVDNWTTLRICGRYGTYLRNGVSGTRNTPMFRVIGNAKLAFNIMEENGVQTEIDNPLIIDGGANFTNMDFTTDPDGVWRMSATSNCRFNVSMLQSIGAVEMYNVTIQNVYIPETGNATGVIGLATPELASDMGYIDSYNLPYRYTKIKNCTIQKCKSIIGAFISVGNCSYMNKTLDPNAADRLVTIENCTIRHNVTFGDTSGWGGLIRCRGGSLYSMVLRNTVFEENFSHNDGATIWWNAGGHPNTKCTIDGCTFRNNRAMRDAGALRLEGSFEFTGAKSTVTGNECLGKVRIAQDPNNGGRDSYVDDPEHPGRGGGIQIYGYAGTQDAMGGTLTYNLPTCLEVSDNYARSYGGGISLNFTNETSLRVGTTVNAEFNGAIIKDNEAGTDGGGIYFSNTSDPSRDYTVNIWLNNGNISGNTSLNGGGLYVKSIDINSQATSEDIIISDNTATAGCGGGIYLSDGDISLQSVDINNNKSFKVDASTKYGGGGVYVSSGSFSIADGYISNNSSDMYGGGVFVQNETANAESQSVALSGGSIQGNNALYGGGLAACGNLVLEMDNVNIESNKALNGGGLFAQGTSETDISLLYKQGIIRNNIAGRDNGQMLSTAYDMSHNSISGMGGGIYLDQHSFMDFPDPQHFGIYQNVAENGADDIFGSNSDVTINLPNIKNLDLTDYTESTIHELYWGEDYITNDTHYGDGLKLKGDLWDQDPTNQRYRDVHENRVSGSYYIIDFGNKSEIVYTDKYLSLTIGWHVYHITIVKEGMNDGENAIFKVYKIDDNGVESEYMTVMLTDADKANDNKRYKELAIKDDGTYKIVETNWSWTYINAQNNEIVREITSTSTSDDYIFVFQNTKRNDVPLHDEDVKINIMRF